MFKFFRISFLFFALNFFSTAHADTPPPPGNNPPPPAGGETLETKLAAALRRTEELTAELEKMKKPKDKEGDGDDNDLRKKVAKEAETKEEIARQTKEIERALGFNMKIQTFVKDNKDLLPGEIEAIIKASDNEKYDTAAAKANVLKAAIIQAYFAVQSNLDLITPAQKLALDDYLKLTKNGKESKAAEIYENIFEPALEMVRRVKKAEEVGRSRTGHALSSDGNTAYKDKMIAQARRAHLGEKTA